MKVILKIFKKKLVWLLFVTATTLQAHNFSVISNPISKLVQANLQTNVNRSIKNSNYTSLKLSITDSQNEKRSTKIFYIANKTLGFDNGYDGSLFGGGGANQSYELFTELLSGNRKRLAIQTLPNQNYEDMIIPIGVVVQANKRITFSIVASNFPTGLQVYLEDRNKGTFTNLLRSNHTITFNNSLNGTGRFYLHTIWQSSFTNGAIWLGNTDTNWDNASNWMSGTVPAVTDNVLINKGANLPVGKAINVVVNDLNIRKNASLLIEENASLTINGNLTLKTNANLNVESKVPSAGVINSGSVILRGSYTEATPNSFRYFTETYHNNDSGWNLVSSPTVGEIIDGGATGFATFNKLQTSAKNNYGIAVYDTSATNKWDYYTTTEIASKNNIVMARGKGYAILPNSIATVTQNKGNIRFKGKVPTANVTIAVTGSGDSFNLIGNPYPSYIPGNNKADVVNNVLAVNKGILSEQTLWFWNKQTESYIAVNHANPKFIPPTQGFFIKSKASGGNFNFTKSMQSHQTNGVYYKNSNTRPEIQVSVSQGKVSKSTDIYYINGTTRGFDDGYDSSIFDGVATNFNVFTGLVATSKNKRLAIQSLPKDNYNTTVIPLGIISEANKKVVFRINAINFPSDVKVYLEDRLLGTFTDVSTKNYEVTFDEKVNGTGRFYIHTSSRALSNEDVVTLDKVIIYPTNNIVNIAGLTADKVKVKIFDLVGKQIVDKKVTSQNLIQINLPPSTRKGMYIVNINTEYGQINKKIMLKHK